jgi:hypothetical protein
LTEPFRTAEFAVTEVADPVLTVGFVGVLVQTLHPFARHVADKAVPSAHFVTPPMQATPPWDEQHPVQSARATPSKRPIRAIMKNAGIAILAGLIMAFPMKNLARGKIG